MLLFIKKKPYKYFIYYYITLKLIKYIYKYIISNSFFFFFFFFFNYTIYFSLKKHTHTHTEIKKKKIKITSDACIKILKNVALSFWGHMCTLSLCYLFGGDSRAHFYETEDLFIHFHVRRAHFKV